MLSLVGLEAETNKAPLSTSSMEMIRATSQCQATSQHQATGPNGHVQSGFTWLTTCHLGVKTVYLYNIHYAHAFSFQFVIFFHTGAHPANEISNWQVFQRFICNPRLVAIPKESSLPYYLFIALERKDGWLLFLSVLAVGEMLTASFRFWTRITESISYDDNHDTTILESQFRFGNNEIV